MPRVKVARYMMVFLIFSNKWMKSVSVTFFVNITKVHKKLYCSFWWRWEDIENIFREFSTFNSMCLEIWQFFINDFNPFYKMLLAESTPLLRGQTWPILIFIIHVKSIKPATTDLRKNLILKLTYSEKATKFFEIFTIDLSYVVPVKSTVEISQNFVAF